MSNPLDMVDMHEPSSYPPVAELVPHEAPMILVDELVEWSPTHARVRAQVRRGGPFVDAGQLPGTILLEYMAQAVAVAEGMSGRVSGRGDIGVLLGVRELNLEVDAVAIGELLDIHVAHRFSDGTLASYDCEIRRAGQLLASGAVNVMMSPPKPGGAEAGLADEPSGSSEPNEDRR
jgi:predicted hotdog family 3-hydroxylacyl-ACP dehydratase